MEYVIKNSRLKEYLYTLGFSYREVPDRTLKRKFVYLFPNTALLKQAITFYTQLHKK